MSTLLTISSLGTVRPHPWEHGTGFFGLCSHSLRWWERLSSLTTTEQPYSSLSHLLEEQFKILFGKRGGKFTHRISNRLSKFLRILGTGFSSAIDIALLSTGQVCCLLSHWMMQSAQKACSHLIMDRVRIFLRLLITAIKKPRLTLPPGSLRAFSDIPEGSRRVP